MKSIYCQLLTQSHCMRKVILLLIGISSSITDKLSHEFHALDCRIPKSVQKTKLEEICPKKEQKESAQKSQVHILQLDRTRVLEGVVCQLRKTKILSYCGQFSHEKLYEPFDILQPEQVAHDKCLQVYKTHLYDREDGKQSMIYPNRPIVYKYLEHGSITADTSNVHCQGESFTIHGKVRSNMLSMVTAEFILKPVKLEYDPKNGLRDLDARLQLPLHCYADRYCYAFNRMYVLLSTQSYCPLYLIRSVEMTQTQYMDVNGDTRTGLVSHDHQLVIEKGTIFQPEKGCEKLPVVLNTNYKELKIVVDQHVSRQIHGVESTMLDINLQMQILHDYANFRAEKLVQNGIHRLAHDICKIDQFGIHGRERAPFLPNYLLQLTGEVITQFKCVNVTVIARNGDNEHGKCYRNAIPLFLGRERMLLTANTRVLMDIRDAIVEPCSTHFPTMIFDKVGNIIVANPKVSVQNATLVQMDNLFTSQAILTHESTQNFALYTEKEMEEYNYMVHFGRVTQGMLTALTEQYCSTKSCGNLINQDLGKSFDLNRLKSVAESYFNLTERIQQFIKSTGHIGGCMFVLYIVIQMFIRLGHAYYLYKNRNHRLHTAFLSAFHRTKVIQEHLLELRELVNANDQNGRD